VITDLTQDYFFAPLSPAVNSGNCAITLPSTTGTPYSCAWAIKTALTDTCNNGDTTSTTDITIAAAAPF